MSDSAHLALPEKSGMRRGACPAVESPLDTGDGLLVRLALNAPVSPESFALLCEASDHLGNGTVEVTQRGSLQVRGLTPSTAPQFAELVRSLQIALDYLPAVLTAPLAGAYGHEDPIVATLAQVRAELVARSYRASIGPKVSVLLDADGQLHLDSIVADMRFRFMTESCVHASIGGDARGALALGWIEPRNVMVVIDAICSRLAGCGGAARARDLLVVERIDDLRRALADVLKDGPPPQPRTRCEPIGTHALADGTQAIGVGLAFGYTSAGALRRLTRLALACGARAVRPVLARTVLIIGVPQAHVAGILTSASEEGLIVAPDDPRRYVVACAGAPVCAAAHLVTRKLAPAVADALAGFIDYSTPLHLSGCTKGCAHPATSVLTVAGPNRLVLWGHAWDQPDLQIATDELLMALQRLGTELRSARLPGETVASLWKRLGRERILKVIRGRPQWSADG